MSLRTFWLAGCAYRIHGTNAPEIIQQAVSSPKADLLHDHADLAA
jgi:lipoprotein-anchoring transpeptidase ErfK/SrfK